MKFEISEQEKLDKWFRHTLYNIEGLSSESYQLADVLKDYVDKRFDLLIELVDDIRNKRI